MKKTTLLTIAVFILVLLNSISIGYLLLRKPPLPPMPGERSPERIIRELSLDKQQSKAFEEMKTAHHDQMLKSNDAFRNAMKQYFELLRLDSVPANEAAALESRMFSIQQERARMTLNHFMELKDLCTPEQKEKFNALIPDLTTVIMPPKGPEVPPRGPRR
ncbi:MAG: Spy/CpxP family protein refolding chaperone [Lewinellaceae bacterium]|nr:Spy/CpxP family protein refolding chaperone [Saprospiraceae bacterium]MCB9342568.1 Spy/CpxP family protein refolding chaperone [Lewinellaceae bacterium]